MNVNAASWALALGLLAPATAFAQAAPASSCPPGSWFCAEPPGEHATPAGQPVQKLQPLPDPEAAEPAPPPPRAHRTPPPPPVVVYEAPAPIDVDRPEAPPPYEVDGPPRRPRWLRQREWGLNLHLEGAAFGSGANQNAAMGGLGGGLRFKPNRYYGFEGDLDFVGGHGWSGDQRDEVIASFNGLLFLNPRDRAQIYLVGGIGWSWAHSTNDPNDPSQASFSNHYTYFGAQAGVGLELRLSRVLALNADVRGFVRTRVDQGASTTPEFTDPSTGQTSNTSGGALLTAGMTLYF